MYNTLIPPRGHAPDTSGTRIIVLFTIWYLRESLNESMDLVEVIRIGLIIHATSAEVQLTVPPDEQFEVGMEVV